MKKTSNQKFPLLGIVFFAVMMAIVAADELPYRYRSMMPVLMVIIVLIAVVVLVVAVLGRTRRSNVHTHDRIDHTTDLKIDKATGKTTSITKTAVQHTPREHWQQQLDTLLANGTIDRKEYQAMMRRKF